ASSTPSSNEIAKKDAKDKTSDNASLRKQEDLLKREADTPIGGGARGKESKEGGLSEKLEEIQSITNEIMVEITIIIEEKIK
ncbi:MAG: hypothetical protein V1709_10915, partial [Planctomycetota bacterium]